VFALPSVSRQGADNIATGPFGVYVTQAGDASVAYESYDGIGYSYRLNNGQFASDAVQAPDGNLWLSEDIDAGGSGSIGVMVFPKKR